MASPNNSGDGKSSPFGNGKGNTGSESGSVKGTQPDMSGTGRATMTAFPDPKPQPRGVPDVQEYGEAGKGNSTGAKAFELVGNEAKAGKTPDVQPTGSSGTGAGRLPVKNLK